MMEENYVVRHNAIKISSLQAFAKYRGICGGNSKDVCFVRAVGVNSAYQQDVENMDKVLSERMNAGQGKYNRFNHLPGLVPMEETAYYASCYEEWVNGGRSIVPVKAAIGNETLQRIIGKACDKVCTLFRDITPNVNPSIEKNFVVKLLYWFDQICMDCMKDYDIKNDIKIVIHGVTKKQEYLFCYLLTLSGIDVLLLQSSADIDSGLEQLHLSEKIVLGAEQDCRLTEYGAVRSTTQPPHGVVNVRRPDRDRRTAGVLKPPRNQAEIKLPEVRQSGREEMKFEDLALLASSVVMIAIHDKNGELVGTGSGIMIGRDGYILTNNHVTSGGRFYSVRMEEEEEIYKTDELIKYNSVLDLAVIRIRRLLKPIPIYQGGQKLVRGQKVVAIGSPLGMFNSVSDGIISGFRNIENVDMIQFTAPTSHGSSGGALLNMYGEVIGISTAGIENGQNINLAVGYESINMFVRGFV